MRLWINKIRCFENKARSETWKATKDRKNPSNKIVMLICHAWSETNSPFSPTITLLEAISLRKIKKLKLTSKDIIWHSEMSTRRGLAANNNCSAFFTAKTGLCSREIQKKCFSWKRRSYKSLYSLISHTELKLILVVLFSSLESNHQRWLFTTWWSIGFRPQSFFSGFFIELFHRERDAVREACDYDELLNVNNLLTNENKPVSAVRVQSNFL